MKITSEIVQRCYNLTYNDLSPDVIDRTKYLLLDYIGVAARGALSDSSLPVQRVISSLDKSRDGAVVFGTDIRANPPYAALANGIASHSLELDDVVNQASLHPAIAKIKTTDGNEYTAKVEYPKGDPENPFTWDEIMQKFRNLISAVFPEARQNQIIETIRSLEQTRDVNELSDLLAKV